MTMMEGGGQPLFRDADIETARRKREAAKREEERKAAKREKAQANIRLEQQNKPVTDNQSEADPTGIFRDADIVEAEVKRQAEDHAVTTPDDAVFLDIERQLLARLQQEAKSVQDAIRRRENANDSVFNPPAVTFDASMTDLSRNVPPQLFDPTTGVDFSRKSTTSTAQPEKSQITREAEDIFDIKSHDEASLNPFANLFDVHGDKLPSAAAVLRQGTSNLMQQLGLSEDAAHQVVYGNIGDMTIKDPAFIPALIIQGGGKALEGLEFSGQQLDKYFTDGGELIDTLSNTPLNKWSVHQMLDLLKFLAIGTAGTSVPWVGRGLKLLGLAIANISGLAKALVSAITAGAAGGYAYAKGRSKGAKDSQGDDSSGASGTWTPPPDPQTGYGDGTNQDVPTRPQGGLGGSPTNDPGQDGSQTDNSEESSGGADQGARSGSVVSASAHFGSGSYGGGGELDYDTCVVLIQGKLATPEQAAECEKIFEERMRQLGGTATRPR